MGEQRRELTATSLGRSLVKAVQYQSIAAGAPFGQPVNGGHVAVKPIATLEAWGHQERRGDAAGGKMAAEVDDIGQRAVADSGNRDDQLS